MNGQIVEDMDEIKFGSLSPLMLAVAQGNVFAVQKLLEKGVDIFEVRRYKKRETKEVEEVPYPPKPEGPGENVFAILKRVEAIHSSDATRDGFVHIPGNSFIDPSPYRHSIFPDKHDVHGGTRDTEPAYDSEGEELHNEIQPHSFLTLQQKYKMIKELLKKEQRKTPFRNRPFWNPPIIDAYPP